MARAAAASSRLRLDRQPSLQEMELTELKKEEKMLEQYDKMQSGEYQGEEPWRNSPDDGGILDGLDPEMVVNELIPQLESMLDVLRPLIREEVPDMDRQASYMSVSSEMESSMDAMKQEALRLNTSKDVGMLEYAYGQAKLQQIKLRLWYDSDTVQIAVAIVIVMNFLTAALGITSWAMNDPDGIGHVLEIIDQFYLYIFLVELIINFAANFLWGFITSGWAWFDSVVVIMPLMTSMYAMSALRVIRILRVVKIFRTAKFDFVRVIIGTIILSLKSVIPIFAVLFGVSVCFCIVAVTTLSGKPDFESGFEVDAHFHDLRHALLTCFQLMTYDSWTAVVRPLAVEESWWWGLLWSVYIFVTGFLLCNMFVAVLCTEMERQMDEQRKRTEIARLNARREKRMLNQMLTTHSNVFDETQGNGSSDNYPMEFNSTAQILSVTNGKGGHSVPGGGVDMPSGMYDHYEYPATGLPVSPRQPGQATGAVDRQESDDIQIIYSPKREKMLKMQAKRTGSNEIDRALRQFAGKPSKRDKKAGASSGSFESQVLQMLKGLRQNQSALESSVMNLRDQVGTLTTKLAQVSGTEGLQRSTSVVHTDDVVTSSQSRGTA